MNPFKILFEDEDFLVAEKPAGIPSQPTLDKGRVDFYTALKEQVAKVGVSYLALHHRLDRDTSGLMIFAKSQRANIPLATLFQEHKIQKTYRCIIQKKPKHDSWEEQNYLAEVRDAKTKKMKMTRVNSGGKPAHTLFSVVERFKGGSLVEAKPLSGRMHQIRVHLAERSYGIFGDDLYPAPKGDFVSRLMLHAFSLEFVHPFSGEVIYIECPLPQDMLKFLASLR